MESIAAELASSLDSLVEDAVFQARGSGQPDGITSETLTFTLTSLLVGALRSGEAGADPPAEVRRLARLADREGASLDQHLQLLGVVRGVLARALEERVRGRARDRQLLLESERRLDRAQAPLLAALAAGHQEAAEERWGRERGRLDSLFRVAAAVNRQLEVDDVARAGLVEVLRGLRLDAGGLWLSDPEEGLVLISAVGVNWEENRLLRAVSARGSWLVSMAACEPGPIQARFHGGNAVISGFRSALASRLEREEEEVLGVMLLASRRDRTFSDGELAYMAEASRLLATGVDRAQRHRLEARTDFLTGLANRQEFERAMDRELASAERHGLPVSLMLIDLDRLKTINDEHGHHAGDVALRTLAELMRKEVRATDTCARLGGDEFALAMPGAELHQAEEVARRLRASLEAANRSGLPMRLEISLGIAGWRPGLSVDQLFKVADDRLYEDKRRHHARQGRLQAGSGG